MFSTVVFVVFKSCVSVVNRDGKAGHVSLSGILYKTSDSQNLTRK